jgi:hypothetical protein
MASAALNWWRTDASTRLDELLELHKHARRATRDQINNLSVLQLSSQFQKFCRDLHSEAATYVAKLSPTSIRAMVIRRFTDGRKLDFGNPSPGNLGNDFNWFGFDFWREVKAANPQNAARQQRLIMLNLWRNAIAHHDYSGSELGGQTVVRLHEIRVWRRACNALATEFDKTVSQNLKKITGASPW